LLLQNYFDEGRKARPPRPKRRRPVVFENGSQIAVAAGERFCGVAETGFC
jgi:hypothetical protein